MNTNKRPIENTDGFPFAKKAKFGSPNNSYRGRGNFPRRGSFRGRGQFNRGRGSFNRGRGRSFQNFRGSRGAGPVRSFYNNEANNCIKVCFPGCKESMRPALNEVLEKCDRITGPMNFVTHWDPQNLIEKLPLLKEIKIDDELLKFKVTSLSESKTKKRVSIPNRYTSNKDKVVKFFNATSISENPLSLTNTGSFILTFPSSDSASKAAKKVMVTDDTIICLKPHHEEDVLYSSTDDKEGVKKLEEKLKTLAKETEIKKVEKISMEVDEEGSEDDKESEEDTDDGEEEEEEEQGGEDEQKEEDAGEEEDETSGEEEEDEDAGEEEEGEDDDDDDDDDEDEDDDE